MKSFSHVILLLSATAMAGCAARDVQVSHVSSVAAGGLEVSVEIPKRDYTVGERFTVTVTARNESDSPVEIIARGGAPVYLRLWRCGELGWEQIHRYPRASTMLVMPWTLAAGQARSFPIVLAVEPDWPDGELLKLTAEINGRNELAPALTLNIHQF